MRKFDEKLYAAALKGSVCSLLIGASAVALPNASFAQDVQDQVELQEDAEEIVVVGSRIRRKSFDDIPQPAVILDAETIEYRGFTNIGDAINEIPSFGVGNSGTQDLGQGQNVGQEFADLFELGTQRTLTVVNGRRFITGNILSADPNGRLEGFQVDLNNFSPAFVERVEVLAVGGAPIYGADAISGVVNVVLKDDFEGLNISAQYGDGIKVSRQDTYTISGEFGANFSDGRGNVATAIQYTNRRGTVAEDFPGLENRASRFPQADGPDVIGDEGRFNILEGPIGFLPAPGPGVPLPFFGANVFTDPDGNILTFAGDGGLSFFDPGLRTGTSAVFGEGGSGFDLDDFEEANTPLERIVFASIAHYDITENVRVFAETNFLNSSATDLINQSSEAFNTAFLSTQGQGSFGISINNPFISDDDRDTLITAGAGDTIFINGINLGLLPDAGSNFADTTTYRVVGGLKGDFEALGGRNFSWEVSMNYGRTEQSRSFTTIRGGAFFNAVDSVELDDTLIAQLTDPDNLARLERSTTLQTINVVRDGQVLNLAPTDTRPGDIICNVFLDVPGATDEDPDNPSGSVGITAGGNQSTPDGNVRGCTPINLFNGFGNPAEAVDFITSPALTRGRVNQVDFLAFISGDVVELPAGIAQFSLGVERRRDSGSFTVGGVLSDGLSRTPPVPGIPREEIVSNEVFGELTVPLLSAEADFGLNDAVGFELLTSLELNGAYRVIDTSNASPESVYSAGGSLSLLEGSLTLRGNFTRAVRQPSLVELFSPPAQTFDQTGDPCDITNINDAPSTNRAQNCVAAAQALGFSDARLIDTGNGNQGLELAIGDGAFTTPSVNAAIPLTTGGNSNLEFEKSDSYTFGFIWSPTFVPGLTVGADYISINISSVVNEPDFSFFTADCFDNSNFATGDLVDSCNNFARTGPAVPVDNSIVGGFDIISGLSGFQNQDTLRLTAIQGNARYNFDVQDAASLFGLGDGNSDWGDITLRGIFYAPQKYRDSANAQVDANGLPVNRVSSLSFPELEFTADFIYRLQGFEFYWRSRYRDNVHPCFTRTDGDCDDIPDFAFNLPRDIQHNLSMGYQVNDNLSFRAGVDDLLRNREKRVEQAFGLTTNGNGNPFGRTYFLRANFRL